jgi:hypothetical protein
MSLNQRDSSIASVALLAIGLLSLLLSLIALGQGRTVAALLLGARFLFDVPYSASDSLKLLFVGFGSGVGILMSLVLIVAGGVVLSRASRAQNGPAGAETFPTHR